MNKHKIIFLGKLPPPFIGPAIAAQLILKSDLANRYKLIHLDTSDHRAFSTLGRIDLGNLFVAIKQYFTLLFLLIKHNPKAVYIPSQQTTVGYLRDVPFIMLTKLFGKKVICHLRGGNFKNWYNSAGKFMQWMVRKTQKKIDGQIVLGECLRYMFTDFMPADKIHVVPNGGDYNVPDKNNKESHFQMVYLGNFIETKGILDVVHSLKHIDKTKVKLVCAGSFPSKEFEQKLYQVIKQNELPVDVIPPISGEDKFQLLRNSDLFVFPTYYPNEGHPWVIIEAMACYLPIISTNHAAIPETVVDGQNGYLVEKESPEQIAEKINYFLENKEVLQYMGQKSRRIYEDKFTERHIVDNLDKAFQRILG